MDDDAADVDPGLLPHLAPHGLLDALGGLEEARECAVPERGPPLLAAQQQLRAARGDDGHDDGWVGAREGDVRDSRAGCAGGSGWGPERGREVDGWAGSLEAGVYGEGWLPAGGAEGVACVPVEEVARGGVDGGCGRK